MHSVGSRLFHGGLGLGRDWWWLEYLLHFRYWRYFPFRFFFIQIPAAPHLFPLRGHITRKNPGVTTERLLTYAHLQTQMFRSLELPPVDARSAFKHMTCMNSFTSKHLIKAPISANHNALRDEFREEVPTVRLHNA